MTMTKVLKFERWGGVGFPNILLWRIKTDEKASQPCPVEIPRFC